MSQLRNFIKLQTEHMHCSDNIKVVIARDLLKLLLIPAVLFAKLSFAAAKGEALADSCIRYDEGIELLHRGIHDELPESCSVFLSYQSQQYQLTTKSTMNFFKKKPTPKEAAKEAKREARKEVRQNQRDLDREIRELDRQEQQIKNELKQRAKKVSSQNDPTLKVLAKQLVQLRQQRDKLFTARSQVGAMGMHATTMASQVAAVSAIGTVTDTLKVANAQMDMKETMKVMSQFQHENEKMAAKEELMDDVLADAFDTEEVEEEAEALTNQVLAELGVEMDAKLVGLDAPQSKPVGEQLSQEEQNALDDALPDLKARLNAL
ncbi:Charged multivesicular body protein [Seminavis robusta]|uniref:Charged multivesicular body protein n=1 Tax=Seminavis robusta TaxID=568900 RepID=A0A9N8EK16_9STRA|nr:Charged multivesicular body protein [Seminavis robusta]|eukprot:Sro1334_g263820.1 Charged multivesicular body protein (320) ;mRNA; f:18688-20182